MKKLISSLLSVALISSAFVVTAFAEKTPNVDAYFVTVADSAETDIVYDYTKVTGSSTEIDAKGVVYIGIESLEKTVSTDGFGIRFDRAKFDLVDVLDDAGYTGTIANNAVFKLSGGTGRNSYDLVLDTTPYNFAKNNFYCHLDTALPDTSKGGEIVSAGFGAASTAAKKYDAHENIAVYKFQAKDGITGDFDFVLYENSAGDAGYVGDVETLKVKVKAADVKVTDITLSTSTIDAQVGNTGTVTATLVPSDATTKGVNFASSNNDVITIDENGNWEAKGEGAATITVTPKETGSTVSKTIAVNVAAAPAPQAALTAVKAVKSNDVANTGYWIYKLENYAGENAAEVTLKFNDKTASEDLTFTSSLTNFRSEGDVSFALYLTATGERIGHNFATSVSVDTLSATGADLVIN